RERLPEQLHESRDLFELRRFEVQHPVRVEQEERQVLLRRIVQRIEAPRKRVRLPGEASEKEAVVEREANHRRRLARDAVELIESSGREKRFCEWVGLLSSRSGDLD